MNSSVLFGAIQIVSFQSHHRQQKSWSSFALTFCHCFVDGYNEGLSTSCSATFSHLLVFGATFCILSNFQFSINSEISEQLLALKLAMLPYLTMFQCKIYQFPVKKEPDCPCFLGQMMGTRCIQLGCQVCRRRFKLN